MVEASMLVKMDIIATLHSAILICCLYQWIFWQLKQKRNKKHSQEFLDPDARATLMYCNSSDSEIVATFAILGLLEKKNT